MIGGPFFSLHNQTVLVPHVQRDKPEYCRCLAWVFFANNGFSTSTSIAVAHASDGFFPWHRWYLWNFENQIRQLGGSYACISIPYWDWTSDAATYGGNFGASPCYLVCRALFL
jgi:hypothetical protein